MRMEGGTRLAFLSFYGVQNARTLVVHAAEPTSKSVSLLALDEAGEAGLPARALMALARAGYSAVLEELGPTPTDAANEGGTPAVRRARSICTRRLRELTQVN